MCPYIIIIVVFRCCSEYESPYLALRNASRNETYSFRLCIRKWYVYIDSGGDHSVVKCCIITIFLFILLGMTLLSCMIIFFGYCNIHTLVNLSPCFLFRYFNRLYTAKLVESKTCLNMLYIEGLAVMEGERKEEIPQEDASELTAIKKSNRKQVMINNRAVSITCRCRDTCTSQFTKFN